MRTRAETCAKRSVASMELMGGKASSTARKVSRSHRMPCSYSCCHKILAIEANMSAVVAGCDIAMSAASDFEICARIPGAILTHHFCMKSSHTDVANEEDALLAKAFRDWEVARSAVRVARRESQVGMAGVRAEFEMRVGIGGGMVGGPLGVRAPSGM